MLPIAKNGNSTPATAFNFIQFEGAESGVLLPSCPGYPDWLPQLQLTPTGRLCFWNFPNNVYKNVVSNPANKTTSQYLRDGARAAANNLFPPIPVDSMGTNGSSNQYFWKSCNTYFKVTAEIRSFFLTLEATRLYVGNQTAPGGNKNATYAELYAGVNFAAVGQYATPIPPWYWIFYNVQWYLNKYLNIPYNVLADPPQGKSWMRQLSEASEKNDLLGWLSATNFFIAPVSDPSFWDKVLNAAPTAILAIVGGVIAIASAGAATPLLATAIGAMAAAGKKASAQTSQAAMQQAYDQAAAGINTGQIKTDVGILTGTTAENNKTIIFFIVAIVILILIVIFYKRK